MNNPLKHYTQQKEQKISVDHAFLNRLEQELFEGVSETQKTKKRWRKILMPVFIIPSVTAVVLVLSFLYSGNKDDSSPSPETPIVLATDLENLFRIDTAQEVRRIEIQNTILTSAGETEIVHHTFWAYNETLREDKTIYKENEKTPWHVSSHLFNREEKKECIFSRRGKKKIETYCYPISKLILHGTLKKPNTHITVQNLSPASPETDDSVSTTYAFYMEWSTPYPVKQVIAQHVTGNSQTQVQQLQFAPWSADTTNTQYLNKEKDGIYYHRSMIEAGTLFERHGLTFQMQIRKKKNVEENSQIFTYNFEDQQLHETAYRDIRLYPIFIIYQSYFSLPLYIAEHAEEYTKYASTSFEERNGKRVTHVHFDVPKSKRNEVEDSINSMLIGDDSWNARVASVDFWYLPYESQLLEYQVWDTTGRMIQQTIILSDEVIDENPEDILSVKSWRKEMKNK